MLRGRSKALTCIVVVVALSCSEQMPSVWSVGCLVVGIGGAHALVYCFALLLLPKRIGMLVKVLVKIKDAGTNREI